MKRTVKRAVLVVWNDPGVLKTLREELNDRWPGVPVLTVRSFKTATRVFDRVAPRVVLVEEDHPAAPQWRECSEFLSHIYHKGRTVRVVVLSSDYAEAKEMRWSRRMQVTMFYRGGVNLEHVLSTLNPTPKKHRALGAEAG